MSGQSIPRRFAAPSGSHASAIGEPRKAAPRIHCQTLHPRRPRLPGPPGPASRPARPRIPRPHPGPASRLAPLSRPAPPSRPASPSLRKLFPDIGSLLRIVSWLQNSVFGCRNPRKTANCSQFSDFRKQKSAHQDAGCYRQQSTERGCEAAAPHPLPINYSTSSRLITMVLGIFENPRLIKAR